MSTKGRILVADDQPDVLLSLRLLLEQEGFEAVCVSSPAAALAEVRRGPFDAALLDLNYAHAATEGREGLDLLARLQDNQPGLAVVVMTAWGSVPTAVEAMRRGARDFIEKPWEDQRLVSVLGAQVALSRALREAAALREENHRLEADRVAEPLLGSSAAMRRVRSLIARVSPSEACVLVTGEHGTGKEVVARQLHAGSARSEGAFVAINAGGFSDGVFDSELFGHARGAFTDAKLERKGAFETADGGTLFLDEVGNMPLSQQQKLLRVLQTREISRVGETQSRLVSVRLIAATNVDLPRAAAAGAFRQDLLYRLNTIEIHLPPLRERGSDVVELAGHFLARASARAGREYRLTAGAVQRLRQHPWPGNVRELAHAIERGVLLAESAEVGPADLQLQPPPPGASRSLSGMTLEEVERTVIESALERCQGNVTHAALQLGLTRSSLYRRLQRYGLQAEGKSEVRG